MPTHYFYNNDKKEFCMMSTLIIIKSEFKLEVIFGFLNVYVKHVFVNNIK